MCVQCLVYSAIMVFMPAPQTANANVVAQVNPPSANYAQVNSSQVARDTQNAIAKMLEQLPNNPDMGLLREGLNSLYGRLATVKDDTEAQTLITNCLEDLSARLKDQPNYEQISQVLKSMLEVDGNQSSAKTVGMKLLHPEINLKTRSTKFGWLF